MDLNNFLEKPECSFSAPKHINIADTIEANLCDENFNVAIIGIDSDNKINIADIIREHLYALSFRFKKIKVADLGNIKKTEKKEDMLAMLKETVDELAQKNIATIIIGNRQSQTAELFEAVARNNDEINLTIIDEKIDNANVEDEEFNFIKRFIDRKELQSLSILGTQKYLSSASQQDEITDKDFDIIRLGIIKNNISVAEPILRDTDILSIDVSSVKQSDAPGVFMPSPNGFFADEICKLAQFAGFSDRLNLFGIFSMNPENDINGQTASLIAQTIWHYLDGFDNRYGDYPEKPISSYKKIHTCGMDENFEMVFYNNEANNRWWIEIPTQNGIRIFSCHEEDYNKASFGEIPDVWFKRYLK